MNSTVISQRQNVTRVENTNSESLLSKLSLVDLGKIQHSIYKLKQSNKKIIKQLKPGIGGDRLSPTPTPIRWEGFIGYPMPRLTLARIVTALAHFKILVYQKSQDHHYICWIWNPMGRLAKIVSANIKFFGHQISQALMN